MKGVRDYLRVIYHWIEASHLARTSIHDPPSHIHAHFINGPTSLAMFLGFICDIPFSFTMHASMIWRDPIALANKLQHCAFCVSISEYNRDYIVSQYGKSIFDKIHVVRCGIEPESIASFTHKQREQGLEILAVGQLNARKGFHYLLEACARLKQLGVEFHCTIVGDGEEREILTETHQRLDLRDSVTLVGSKTQEQIKDYFAAADIFALPCVISKDGWRDGIPVALMEAMAWQIPVVTTNILGLPELVISKRTGMLVEPEDPEMLANTIERLLLDPALRQQLGEAGKEWVEKQFNVDRSAESLATLFEKSQLTTHSDTGK